MNETCGVGNGGELFLFSFLVFFYGMFRRWVDSFVVQKEKGLDSVSLYI